jgi:hemin uptake protein HemP
MDRPTHAPDTTESPRIASAALFPNGRQVVTIVHAGQEYRLRITKANKLILTK